MSFRPEEISAVLQKELESYDTKLETKTVGVVLSVGDSACFPADVEHGYAAVGDQACVLHDLVQYASSHAPAGAAAAQPPGRRRKPATSAARRKAGS